jgi:hypothetical protein
MNFNLLSLNVNLPTSIGVLATLPPNFWRIMLTLILLSLPSWTQTHIFLNHMLIKLRDTLKKIMRKDISSSMSPHKYLLVIKDRLLGLSGLWTILLQLCIALNFIPSWISPLQFQTIL